MDINNLISIDKDDLNNLAISYLKTRFPNVNIDLYRTDVGKLFIENFNYVVSTLIQQFEVRLSNLNFEDVTDPVEETKLINFFNYQISTNASSYVKISASFADTSAVPFGNFIIPKNTKVTGKNSNNTSVNLYIRNSLTDYFSDVVIPSKSNGYPDFNFTVNAYSGLQVLDTFDRTTVTVQVSEEKFTLANNSVIKGSIKALYRKVVSGTEEVTELQEFKNFLDIPPLYNGIPFYVTYDINYNAVLNFGATGQVNVLPIGGSVEAYYLVGGGSLDNIVANSVTGTVSITKNNITTTLNVTNGTDGFGGIDGDTMEQIKVFAPASIATQDGTLVRKEGYEYYLLKNGLAKYVKIMEAKELIDYGINSLPLFSVMMCVIPNRTINTLNDLRITKQVDDKNTIVGGEIYHILNLLEGKKIDSFYHVVVPSTISVLDIFIEVGINKYIHSDYVYNLIYKKIYNKFSINTTSSDSAVGYGKSFNKNSLVTYLQKDINGISYVDIKYIKLQKYYQKMDVDITSFYYFGFVNETTPNVVEVTGTYQLEPNEIMCLLNDENGNLANLTINIVNV